MTANSEGSGRAQHHDVPVAALEIQPPAPEIGEAVTIACHCETATTLVSDAGGRWPVCAQARIEIIVRQATTFMLLDAQGNRIAQATCRPTVVVPKLASLNLPEELSYAAASLKIAPSFVDAATVDAFWRYSGEPGWERLPALPGEIALAPRAGTLELRMVMRSRHAALHSSATVEAIEHVRMVHPLPAWRIEGPARCDVAEQATARLAVRWCRSARITIAGRSAACEPTGPVSPARSEPLPIPTDEPATHEIVVEILALDGSTQRHRHAIHVQHPAGRQEAANRAVVREAEPPAPDAAAVAPDAASVAPRTTEVPRGTGKHAFKFRSLDETRMRKRVAWVSAIACLFFVACAVAGVLRHTAFMPVPFGSSIWIELAVEMFPQAYFLGPIHNIVLACVAASFLVAATNAHVEVPGNPRSDSVVVWRRQSRFAYSRSFLAAALFVGGATLQVMGHPLLAALLESPAFGLALATAAHLWVPIARQFVVVEASAQNDGLGNRIVVGGVGLQKLRCSTVVIFQDQLDSALRRSSVAEHCLGMASLCLRFHDRGGHLHEIRVRAFGSARMVAELVHYLNGEFRVARSLHAAKVGPYPWARPTPAPARPAR